MNKRNWWRGLRRWEKALAAAGIAGTATLVVAVGVQGAHERTVPATVLEPCGMSIIAVDFDDTGFDCNPQHGQEVDVHYRDYAYSAPMQAQCDMVGGQLKQWATGEWVCEDVDF